VGKDTYYLDTMCRTVSIFPSQSAVDYEKNQEHYFYNVLMVEKCSIYKLLQ
jgi:hypothetical protein